MVLPIPDDRLQGARNNELLFCRSVLENDVNTILVSPQVVLTERHVEKRLLAIYKAIVFQRLKLHRKAWDITTVKRFLLVRARTLTQIHYLKSFPNLRPQW